MARARPGRRERGVDRGHARGLIDARRRPTSTCASSCSSRSPPPTPTSSRRCPTECCRIDGRSRPARVAAESTWLAAARRGSTSCTTPAAPRPLRRAAPYVLTLHDLQPLERARPPTAASSAAYLARSSRGRCGARAGRRARASSCAAPCSTALGRRPPTGRGRSRTASPAPPGGPPPGDVLEPATTSTGPWCCTRPSPTPTRTTPPSSRPSRACAGDHPDAVLVLTGRRGRARAGGRGPGRPRSGCAASVRRLGRIPTADVAGLYGWPTVVAVPSRYEGFGLPAARGHGRGRPRSSPPTPPRSRRSSGTPGSSSPPGDVDRVGGRARRPAGRPPTSEPAWPAPAGVGRRAFTWAANAEGFAALYRRARSPGLSGAGPNGSRRRASCRVGDPMGKASSSKKVARAARAGGRVSSGQPRSLLFPGVLTLVVVLGIGLVVYARNDRHERRHRRRARSSATTSTRPSASTSAASSSPTSPSSSADVGIHTHGDGVHPHPPVLPARRGRQRHPRPLPQGRPRRGRPRRLAVATRSSTTSARPTRRARRSATASTTRCCAWPTGRTSQDEASAARGHHRRLQRPAAHRERRRHHDLLRRRRRRHPQAAERAPTSPPSAPPTAAPVARPDHRRRRQLHHGSTTVAGDDHHHHGRRRRHDHDAPRPRRSAMQAVVLVGGFGTRLRPLTLTRRPSRCCRSATGR